LRITLEIVVKHRRPTVGVQPLADRPAWQGKNAQEKAGSADCKSGKQAENPACPRQSGRHPDLPGLRIDLVQEFGEGLVLHVHDIAGLDLGHRNVTVVERHLRRRRQWSLGGRRPASAGLPERGAVVETSSACMDVMPARSSAYPESLDADRNADPAFGEMEAERPR
jgi:hypothetical protein